MHFYEFKAMAREALLPPMGLLVLSAIGVVLLALRWRRSGWTCLGLGLSLMWVLSMPIVADTLTFVVQAYPAFNPATATDAQAIVILGGAEGQRDPAAEYGTEPAAQLELLDRLNYGAWLSRRTHLPILVTSDPMNARVMAVSLIRDFRMPPRWIDTDAHDTYENARNSARMLHADHVSSILLVTSTTHMLRSVREFSATGLAVTAAPDQVLIRNEGNAVRAVSAVQVHALGGRHAAFQPGGIRAAGGARARGVRGAAPAAPGAPDQLGRRALQRPCRSEPEAGDPPAHHHIVERPYADVISGSAGGDQQRHQMLFAGMGVARAGACDQFARPALRASISGWHTVLPSQSSNSCEPGISSFSIDRTRRL